MSWGPPLGPWVVDNILQILRVTVLLPCPSKPLQGDRETAFTGGRVTTTPCTFGFSDWKSSQYYFIGLSSCTSLLWYFIYMSHRGGSDQHKCHIQICASNLCKWTKNHARHANWHHAWHVLEPTPRPLNQSSNRNWIINFIFPSMLLLLWHVKLLSASD